MMDILSVLSDFSISPLQLYFISFILGSFSVATLSDLKYMGAQKEFLEIWALISMAFMGYDAYSAWKGGDWTYFAVKWSIILFFAIISYQAVGIYFRLALGDVLACIAAASVFPIALVIVFFLILKLLNLALSPFLGIFGDRSGYPFMPVVFLSVIGTIGLSFYVSGIPPF